MSQETSPEWVYSSIGDDPDMGDLVEMFVDELPNRVATLRQHGAAEDWEALERTAHQLKGAAGSYGFDQVTPIAAALEQSCEEFRSQREISAQLEQLIDLCNRLRAGAPE
jgi:HPt (histidine-containing phosphotransfer) domain-containing protein